MMHGVNAARIERQTAIHRNSSVRILTIYIEKGGINDQATGFPVSGDMLAVVRKGSRTAFERRRRLAARLATRQETQA